MAPRGRGQNRNKRDKQQKKNAASKAPTPATESVEISTLGQDPYDGNSEGTKSYASLRSTSERAQQSTKFHFVDSSSDASSYTPRLLQQMEGVRFAKITGVTRVAMRRRDNVISVNRPMVYRCLDTDTYFVFGIPEVHALARSASAGWNSAASLLSSKTYSEQETKRAEEDATSERAEAQVLLSHLLERVSAPTNSNKDLNEIFTSGSFAVDAEETKQPDPDVQEEKEKEKDEAKESKAQEVQAVEEAKLKKIQDERFRLGCGLTRINDVDLSDKLQGGLASDGDFETDLQLIMDQTGASRKAASTALLQYRRDVVDSVLKLS